MENRLATRYQDNRQWTKPVRSVLLLLAPLLLLLVGCEEKKVAGPPPPPDVDVVDVVQKDVPIYSEWVAQLNGDTNAQITPKVQGYVLRKNYNEGYYVKKGELLFEIDPRPFEAALDQANAQLAVTKANLSRTETDVVRDTPLAAQNAIPQKQLDNDLAAQAAAKAQVEAAKAMVEQAKLNLEWTKVYSPIDGIAGVANSQVGDLVGTTTKMTTISKVNPIRAYFSISENMFLQTAVKINDIVRGLSSNTGPAIEYIQANEEVYPVKGKIILVNREVTTQTGTIQMAAEFSNPDAILRPGGFGRVRMQTGFVKGAMLIPQRAVVEVQGAYQAVVVGADNRAAYRPIKVGDRFGTNWIVTDGLKPGEKVIAQGFQKVRDGMVVSPKPFVEGAAAEGK